MGWKIHEVQDWTRKGSGEHKNTNIDIILTRDIEEKDIKVSLLEYNENISDHKPIRVTINNKRISKPKKKDKEMIIDKKWLKKTSIECLYNIIDATNMTEIMKAFDIIIK